MGRFGSEMDKINLGCVKLEVLSDHLNENKL